MRTTRRSEDSTLAALELLHGASAAAVSVFTTILTRGPISRIDVARASGLSQAAVTKAVIPLLAVGLVSDDHDSLRDGHPGRPANPLSVVPDALISFGVKVNAEELIGVATDLTTGVLATSHYPLGSTTFEDVVEGIVTVADRLTASLGDRSGRIACLGIAVSGDVDTQVGLVRASPLMGWTDQNLGTILEQRLSIRVVVENDVRALTIGEHWFGVGLGTASFAIVTIGRGIGSGIHVNGEVVEGAYGVAGEIGHLPLTSPDKVCTCGRRGCVEAVASSSAIVAAASVGRSGPELSIAEVVALAHAGDPTAVRAFENAGTVIGTAIATLVNLTGPELVIIGGEAVSDFDLFDESLRNAFTAHTFGAAVNCRIVIRPHTFEDWARGVSAAGIRSIVAQHRR